MIRMPSTRTSRANDRATNFPSTSPLGSQTKRSALKGGKKAPKLREEVHSDDQILINSSQPTLGAAKRLPLESEMA